MPRIGALLLGGGLLAVLAGAFYLLSGAPPPASLFALIRGEQAITPGFIGVSNFGRWRLICVPGPAALVSGETNREDLATAVQHPVNTCRVNLELPAGNPASSEGPGQIIVAANFSLVGDKRMPAVMLRLPATAQVGDIIELGFDNQARLQTSVRNCSDSECMAAGTLSQTEWAQLIATQYLQVTFPASGRQWVLLSLPGEGLSAAIAAMSRAQLSSPS